MKRSKKQITEEWKQKNRDYWTKHDPYALVKHKKCSICKIEKKAKAFARNIDAKYGLQSWCSECRHSKHVNDPRKQMYANTKARAIRNKLDFNLSLDDIVIPKTCPVLGISILIIKGQQDNSPSLDRLIPEKGYVKGNIQVISWRANDLKKNASIEEMEKILQYLKKIYENKISE